MEKLENAHVYIKRIDYGQKKFLFSITCILSMIFNDKQAGVGLNSN